eukprot:11027816-Alexandrium_andersonii.AAC.1
MGKDIQRGAGGTEGQAETGRGRDEQGIEGKKGEERGMLTLGEFGMSTLRRRYAVKKMLER